MNEQQKNIYKDLLYTFDNQIKLQKQRLRTNRDEVCYAWWDKKLFMYNCEMTIEDWRNIRSLDFFYDKIRDKKGNDRTKFLVERIEKYLGK